MDKITVLFNNIYNTASLLEINNNKKYFSIALLTVVSAILVEVLGIVLAVVVSKLVVYTAMLIR